MTKLYNNAIIIIKVGDNVKEFKNLEEQIHILKNKGIVISNELDTQNKLLIGNFYNIVNGYKTPFLKSDQSNTFTEGCSFEEIYELYNFDRNLRSIIFPAILSIENKLRSLIAYYFSEKYGNSNYLSLENFDLLPNSSQESRLKRRAYVLELIASMHNTISNAVGKKEYITHYISKYGFVPLWVLVNDLTLGQLSKFYSLMKQPEKIKISKYWKNLKYVELESFMKTLSYFRNLCAHDDRIYNARSVYPISDTDIHENLSIQKDPSGNYLSGKKDFLSLLIALKSLLSEEEFIIVLEKITVEIQNLQQNIQCISIEKITTRMGLDFDINDMKK